MVFTLCSEILAFPESSWTKVLIRCLNHLHLTPTNYSTLRQVDVLAEKMLKVSLSLLKYNSLLKLYRITFMYQHFYQHLFRNMIPMLVFVWFRISLISAELKIQACKVCKIDLKYLFGLNFDVKAKKNGPVDKYSLELYPFFSLRHFFLRKTFILMLILCL